MATSISGDAALAGFRGGLTGGHGLDLVRRHGGRALVQFPVGVGKSRWIDEITLEAVRGRDYDLVVVLCPTRQLIRERLPLRSPPPGVKVVDLRPRPAASCGPDRDALWKRLEAADLGALGRAEVCGTCPLLRSCYWPGQYGAALRGARIAYATQAHLERFPGFVEGLKARAGADRVLTLLDEADFIGKSREVTVEADELDRFADAVAEVAAAGAEHAGPSAPWLDLIEALGRASTIDLQEGRWAVPLADRGWAAAVQRAGLDRHGDAFRFLGNRLGLLSSSPIETRSRDERGGLQFACRPLVGDCLIFSGTTDLAFARHRLGIEDLASPFAEHEFRHPETSWYNIASPIGTRRYFARHASQVLDFFAELIARRSAEGRRILLVAKKCFVDLCAAGMDERFTRMGAGLRILTGGFTEQNLADARVVPLINYGLVGTNLFEAFDSVYCLTGYYVDERVVDACLQDMTRRDLRLPIRIETSGSPRRRRAGLADLGHLDYDVASLVQPALEFKEHGVVIQAVGRVRPFTTPCEVVTFQMADLPGVAYEAEFTTLAQARHRFGILAGGKKKKADRASLVASLRNEGRTQDETAAILGVTTRTIRNYENKRGGKSPS